MQTPNYDDFLFFLLPPGQLVSTLALQSHFQNYKPTEVKMNWENRIKNKTTKPKRDKSPKFYVFICDIRYYVNANWKASPEKRDNDSWKTLTSKRVWIVLSVRSAHRIGDTCAVVFSVSIALFNLLEMNTFCGVCARIENFIITSWQLA